LPVVTHPVIEQLAAILARVLRRLGDTGKPAVLRGAPLRLRVETELGLKMVKWLRRIEFVADCRDLGAGQGGPREDNMFYEQTASI
jgi:DMSO/TMAO reductase YedYZ molybdopterin-dependent catalytic subunit